MRIMESSKQLLKLCKSRISRFIESNKIYILTFFFIFMIVIFIEILRGDLNLASALVAFGTLTLALATFLNIFNSRDRETRERKERLLNEIISWATDIIECGIVPDVVETMRLQVATSEEQFTKNLVAHVRYKFQGIRVRNTYIKEITLDFSQELQASVQETMDKMSQQITILNQVSDGVVERIVAGKHRSILEDSASKVIKEATRIKTTT